jgi:hypothetical protein
MNGGAVDFALLWLWGEWQVPQYILPSSFIGNTGSLPATGRSILLDGSMPIG